MDGKDPSLPTSMILRHSQHGTAGCHRYAARRVAGIVNLHVRLDLDASQILGRKAEEEPCIGLDHMGHTAFGTLPSVLPVREANGDRSDGVADLIFTDWYRRKSPTALARWRLVRY